MVKITIEGDLDKEHIIKIGKLVVKMFKGKKEHANMFIENTKDMSIKDVRAVMKVIWGEAQW